MNEWKMRPIGYIRSSYTDTKQVPKGLGTKHTLEGTLDVLPEFEEGLLDIEGYSHLFILWVFHRGRGYELIGRPPTDNRPHGVFSTRSPRRPNAIGLTVVELLKREGPILHLRGVDMLDGTPVLDIKPYTSSIPMDKLRRGWLEEAEKRGAADRQVRNNPG
jgi:tRNA-Thr(GGU) m(6)t(6)A37 methyltransferase TsaA